MAEIYPYTEQLRKLFMIGKQDVVIYRKRFQLGKPGFDAQEGNVHVWYCYAHNPLDENSPALAVADNKQNSLSCFARNNEVGFGIADMPPSIDIAWSFVDEGAVRECGNLRVSASPACPFAEAVIFDFSSIDARNIAVDALFRYGR